jgi:hypothetical protein
MNIKHEIILFAGGALFGFFLSAAFAVGWVAVRLTEGGRL